MINSWVNVFLYIFIYNKDLLHHTMIFEGESSKTLKFVTKFKQCKQIPDKSLNLNYYKLCLIIEYFIVSQIYL